MRPFDHQDTIELRLTYAMVHDLKANKCVSLHGYNSFYTPPPRSFEREFIKTIEKEFRNLKKNCSYRTKTHNNTLLALSVDDVFHYFKIKGDGILKMQESSIQVYVQGKPYNVYLTLTSPLRNILKYEFDRSSQLLKKRNRKK
jgi:hypothetical protein